MDPYVSILLTVTSAVLASSGLWAFISHMIDRKKSPKYDVDDIGNMCKGLGHDRLRQLCDEYIDRGYITADEYDNLIYMYEPYKKLGGNGKISKRMEIVDKLEYRED